MKKIKRLLDEYRFPGYRPKAAVKGKFGDNRALVIYLDRLQKKQSAAVVAKSIKAFMTIRPELSGICPAERKEFICRWRCGG